MNWKEILMLVAVVVFVLGMAISSCIYTSDQIEKCHDAGGVSARGICFQPNTVINLKDK